jgi:hypothetical protein
MYYIIAISIFLIIVVYFFSTIFTVISSITSNFNSKSSAGGIWFIALLIINVTLITFTCAFYYYTLDSEGIKGTAGHKGINGQQGDECSISLLDNRIC